MTICVQVFVRAYIFISLVSIHKIRELLCRMTFNELSECFPKQPYRFTFPQPCIRISIAPHHHKLINLLFLSFYKSNRHFSCFFFLQIKFLIVFTNQISHFAYSYSFLITNEADYIIFLQGVFKIFYSFWGVIFLVLVCKFFVYSRY